MKPNNIFISEPLLSVLKAIQLRINIDKFPAKVKTAEPDAGVTGIAMISLSEREIDHICDFFSALKAEGQVFINKSGDMSVILKGTTIEVPVVCITK